MGSSKGAIRHCIEAGTGIAEVPVFSISSVNPRADLREGGASRPHNTILCGIFIVFLLYSPGAPERSAVHKTTQELLASSQFRQLVARRWRVSLLLTVALFVLYYGYILLVATNKGFLSRRIGAVTTLGIPLGAAVIVGAWVLTALYVLWANRAYDAEVARLRDHLVD